ncbi:tRNA pseudouridine(54/55) synthase Pus10 [Candidatus Bathyarchaeota archaeon]|nr:tRNA pseudouridine(54/55) synthase Pus10 [Candidatus Bathyarchaeota archaeon]
MILEEALALLEEAPLCDHCLGRQFAMLGHGLSNLERGRSIKTLLIATGHAILKEKNHVGATVLQAIARNGFSDVARETLISQGFKVEKEADECYLCQGTFNKLGELVEQCVAKLSEYEYNSYIVGVHVPSDIENREDELRAKHHLAWGESIRNEFSREIGKRIQITTGKTVELKKPDILVTVNPFREDVSLGVNAVFIAGRYRKLVRGIPQSRWLCSNCQGRGCEECGGTGKLYQDSVEELIGNTMMKAFEGTNFTLHAAGREDIDVRTFGDGRPFVMDIERPKKRLVDLSKLTTVINNAAEGKIEVKDLRNSSREEIRRIKESSQTSKTYQAIVKFDEEVTDTQLRRLETELEGHTVEQLTPTRVAHRRANLVRKKYIYELKTRRMQPNLAELVLRCQGGLYIKELISGDGGRTKPSVCEILGVPAKCLELDVLDVETCDIS